MSVYNNIFFNFISFYWQTNPFGDLNRLGLSQTIKLFLSILNEISEPTFTFSFSYRSLQAEHQSGNIQPRGNKNVADEQR